MGKRRIRNLHFLGIGDITCYDIRSDRMEEARKLYGVKTIDQKEDITWEHFTHCIVSTPPDCHAGYAATSVENGLHTFVEASVVDDGFDILEAAMRRKPGVVLAPSCTMRFDPLLLKAKSLLDAGVLGKIRVVSHYFGQYLPYWHPYENIRDFYVSKKATGAAREIVPFDLVYLTWLFGDLQEINSLIKNTGDLEVDIDDIYNLTASTTTGTLMNLTIEVLSKVSYRETKVVGQHGNLEIDNVKGELRFYHAQHNAWQFFRRQSLQSSVSTEDMYVQEMKAFLKAGAGEEPFPYTLEEDHRILNLLYKAEQAFLQKQTLSV
jgi:predicted dehydrogenase